MTKTLNDSVAIICDDLTEFFVYRKAIDRMIKENIPVDIIVPYDSGYNGLAEHTLKEIKKIGYSPKDDVPKNKKYKVLLTPYPGLEAVKRTNYVYQLQLSYGAISTKPYPTYLPITLLDYDGIFCFNNYDKDFYGAYGGKIYTIPYWRYHNFKKKPQHRNKPTLLILPTFGSDTSLINLLTNELIEQLKNSYYVITKAHHAIHFGVDGKEPLQIMKKVSDEFYDSDTPIDELLKKADLVLSDNSGAIFESICAGIPVAVFSKNPNSRHLETIDTIQSKIITQKILPYTDDPKHVLQMLSNITSYYKKQQKLRSELFISDQRDPFKKFITIIKYYLSLNEKNDYYKILHDIMLKEWYKDKKTIEEQSIIIQKQKQEIAALLNSTSWKITKPVRSLKRIWRTRVK